MMIKDFSRWNDIHTSNDEWKNIVDTSNDIIEYMYKYEYSRIRAIKNLKEQKEQMKLYDSIIDQIYELEEIEYERQKNIFLQSLGKFGVMKQDCNYSYREIRRKWKESFLSDVSETDLKNCPINEYLWNAFSYNLVSNYLTGKDAQEYFKKINMENVYVMDENESKVYYFKISKKYPIWMLRILDGKDLYIIDSDFKWTYILTHESSIHPILFCRE